MLIFFSFFILIFQQTHCKTIQVDGLSKWRNPVVHVGDSIIFNHKYQYKLYIFQNRGAFSLCNFTQATLLDKPNSTTYIWHPSRLGFFYFSFNNNGSAKPCQQGQKLAIEVLSPAPAQEIPPLTAPVPASSGSVASSPAHRWPFRTRPKALPGTSPPATVPSLEPYNGVPFISSNPAVPLPTGEVDSATIRPLPTSGDRAQEGVGLLAVQVTLCYAIALML